MPTHYYLSQKCNIASFIDFPFRFDSELLSSDPLSLPSTAAHFSHPHPCLTTTVLLSILFLFIYF